MNPAFLDDMSWEMAEVYGAITDQILINLAKYFPYYTAGTVPKSAFTYQAKMLAQMGQVNRETVAIIRNGLKNADKALASTLEQTIIDSVSKAEKPLLRAVKAGIFAPPTTPIVSPNQMRAFKLYYTQASSKLNLVNTVMLESTGSAYEQAVKNVALQVQINERIVNTQKALDVGAGETITGVSSWNEAVRHSIDRMKQNGITGFIDHAGRHWSAEAYTAMDIRTTLMNTGRAAVWETNENFGNDLYIVSYHSGARPLCYDWQLKVISSMNNARDVVDLDGNPVHVYAQSETTYGEPAGLFGINCKHVPNPFIPGVSVIRGEVESPEENAKNYAESQEQRRLERKLREEKRDVLMAKAQGASPEEIKALEAKARKTSSDINDFCDNTGRARHRDREAVYTDRSFPAKETYDVGKFEREQKAEIEQFYQSGGAQQAYKAGVLVPNVPLVAKPQPAPQPTPTTTQAAVPPTTPATPAAATPTQTTPPVVQSTQPATSEIATKTLPNSGIATVDLKPWDHTPTEQEIVAAIGGADKTSGSCASVALSYAGNKAGYQVHDFRGGLSMDFFSKKANTTIIAQLPGVNGVVITSAKEMDTAHTLLGMMQPGKQYFLGIGRHASIVRLAADGVSFEYLELQSATNNGWHALNDFELKYRFGCVKKRSVALNARLIDVEKLGQSPEFPEILRYINTDVANQKKGVGGGIK